MPMNDTSAVALLVIDVQQGLDSPSFGLRNNPQAEFINPATKYVAFSQRVSARSKASERRFSHSKASSDNAAAGRHALA